MSKTSMNVGETTVSTSSTVARGEAEQVVEELQHIAAVGARSRGREEEEEEEEREEELRWSSSCGNGCSSRRPSKHTLFRERERKKARERGASSGMSRLQV